MSHSIQSHQNGGDRSEIQAINEEREPNMWAFIAPFLAFMAIGMLYPKFESVFRTSADQTVTFDLEGEQVLEINPTKTNWYIGLIGLQVIVASTLLFYFRNIYLAQFPFRISWLAVPVGVIGVIVWIGICELGIERSLLEPFGWANAVEVRASFNPFEQITDQPRLVSFLVLRFCLLAVLVPIIEELFVRGWLIRYLENPQWWVVRLTELSFKCVAAATLYGVLAHPGEAVAALVWFSLISWLMLRTGNLWDCIVAHGVTNLLLGLYIVKYGTWHLW